MGKKGEREEKWMVDDTIHLRQGKAIRASLTPTTLNPPRGFVTLNTTIKN